MLPYLPTPSCLGHPLLCGDFWRLVSFAFFCQNNWKVFEGRDRGAGHTMNAVSNAGPPLFIGPLL